MSTPAQKRAAATNAMTALAKKSPALANRIVDDFIGSGFTYSSRVRNDVSATYLLDPSIASALHAFFSDRVAVQQEGRAVFAQIGQPVGAAVGAAAKATADVGQKVAGAAGDAITSLNPLAGLFQAAIWLRVAEVTIGVLLLGVGIAKITNAVPIATKVAKTVSRLPI